MADRDQGLLADAHASASAPPCSGSCTRRRRSRSSRSTGGSTTPGGSPIRSPPGRPAAPGWSSGTRSPRAGRRVSAAPTGRSTFRLDQGGPVPDGIGENTYIPVFFRLSRNIGRQAQVDFYAAALANGRLKVKNQDGNDLATDDYQTAPAAGPHVPVPVLTHHPTTRRHHGCRRPPHPARCRGRRRAGRPFRLRHALRLVRAGRSTSGSSARTRRAASTIRTRGCRSAAAPDAELQPVGNSRVPTSSTTCRGTRSSPRRRRWTRR